MNYDMLKMNAIDAINALLEAQLKEVSKGSGIDMNILRGYVGELRMEKKRAPAKKKEQANAEQVVQANAEQVDGVAIAVVEKKKRAPAKKKEQANAEQVVQANAEQVVQANAVQENAVQEVVVEKKKRAPAKKKEQANAEKVAVKEKKKRAPAKKKVPVDAECYICQSKKELRSTGKLDGFVCWKCTYSNENPNGFCVMCEDYEEIDNFKLCVKCQEADGSTIKLESSESESLSEEDSDDELLRTK